MSSSLCIYKECVSLELQYVRSSHHTQGRWSCSARFVLGGSWGAPLLGWGGSSPACCSSGSLGCCTFGPFPASWASEGCQPSPSFCRNVGTFKYDQKRAPCVKCEFETSAFWVRIVTIGWQGRNHLLYCTWELTFVSLSECWVPCVWKHPSSYWGDLWGRNERCAFPRPIPYTRNEYIIRVMVFIVIVWSERILQQSPVCKMADLLVPWSWGILHC